MSHLWHVLSEARFQNPDVQAQPQLLFTPLEPADVKKLRPEAVGAAHAKHVESMFPPQVMLSR